ncbi:MAG: site-specific integrase [Bacteroidetes bacterium]|nr:MAG: site-specific integrase [Bacteroidota bacterium]
MSDLKTFKLLFYINRAKKTKKGFCSIIMRITINGQASTLRINKSVKPAVWNSSLGYCKAKTEEHELINTQIDAFKARAYRKYSEIVAFHDEIDPQMLKEAILGINSAKAHTIVNVWIDYNDGVKKLIGKEKSYTTWQKSNTCLNYFKEFLEYQYQKKDLSMKVLRPKHVSDFELFLKLNKECGYNTTTKYLQNFKKITNIGLRNNWLKINPFIDFKLKLKEVDRPFLSEEELQRIINKDISIQRLRLVRDIFVFSCFTGLAYSDIKKLKRSEIEKTPDGMLWVRTRRKKTNTVTHVPILDVPMKIIKQYVELDRLNPDDTILPVISNQKTNSYLKEISDICGIDKNITFHIARHTFATTITLMNGISIESVSKMLGHKDIRTTQHYAKIVDRKIGAEMSSISAKLNTVF